MVGVLAWLMVNKFYHSSEPLITGNLADIEWYDTNEEVFTITTAQELYDIATLSDFYNFEGQTFYLGADIVINEGNAGDWAEKAPINKWYPINGFAGTFDGKGHTISGVYGRSISTAMALFTNASSSAIVRDFKLLNSYFEAEGSGGTASIASKGGGTYQRIYSDAILSCDGDNCGGIMSLVIFVTTIEECWFDGEIYIAGRVAGGIADSSVKALINMSHCLFSGKINSSYDLAGSKVGGLCGALIKNAGSLELNDSLSSGEITTRNVYYTGSVLGVCYSGAVLKSNHTYGSMDSYDAGIGKNGSSGSINGAPIELLGECLNGENGYRWTDLDFENYWAIVEGGTPILKYFAEKTIDVSGLKKPLIQIGIRQIKMNLFLIL